MEPLAVLRSANCDVLEFVTSSCVAMSGSRRSYFVQLAGGKDVKGPSPSASVPGRAAAFAPWASHADKTCGLLVVPHGSPRQVQYVPCEGQLSSTTSTNVALLPNDADSDIVSLTYSEGILGVQLESSALHLYRLDDQKLTTAHSLRLLLAVADGKFHANSSLVISPAVAGVQEVLVFSPNVDGTATLAVIEASTTVASVRSTTTATLPTGALNKSLAIRSFTVSWALQMFAVVFDEIPVTVFTAALKGPTSSFATHHLNDDCRVIHDIAAGPRGLWVAATSAANDSIVGELRFVGAEHNAQVKSPFISVGPFEGTLRIVCNNQSLVVLHGKRILKKSIIGEAAAALEQSEAAPPLETSLEEELMLSQKALIAKGSKARLLKAEGVVQQWLEYLRQPTKSQRPTAVLRDCVFISDSETASSPPHLLLDAILSQQHSGKKGVSAETTKHQLLQYLREARGVRASTLLQAALSVNDAAFLLAAASVVVAGLDENGISDLCGQWPNDVRNARLRDDQVVELCGSAFAAAICAISCGSLASLPLLVAILDSLVIVHGRAIAANERSAMQCKQLSAIISEFADWSLEEIGSRLGNVTAHCGPAFDVRKEAEVLERIAHRIRTTKEADITTEVIRVKGTKKVSQ